MECLHEAILETTSIWASLLGAGYGQHEHELMKLLQIYAEGRTGGNALEQNVCNIYCLRPVFRLALVFCWRCLRRLSLSLKETARMIIDTDSVKQ